MLLNGGNTMFLQMFLGSMNHLHRNKLETKINIPLTPSLYPLFSNRAMISPTNPLMTPSGLTAIKVCSVDIFRVSGIVCCELKSLVIWKASVKVIKLKMKVVKKINRVVIQKKSSLHFFTARGRLWKQLSPGTDLEQMFPIDKVDTNLKRENRGKSVCLVLYKCIFDVDWVDSWSWTPKMHTTTINKIL